MRCLESDLVLCNVGKWLVYRPCWDPSVLKTQDIGVLSPGCGNGETVSKIGAEGFMIQEGTMNEETSRVFYIACSIFVVVGALALAAVATSQI